MLQYNVYGAGVLHLDRLRGSALVEAEVERAGWLTEKTL